MFSKLYYKGHTLSILIDCWDMYLHIVIFKRQQVINQNTQWLETKVDNLSNPMQFDDNVNNWCSG